MTYLEELKEHYKAVRARLRANAILEKKLLPKRIPDFSELGPEPKKPRAGLVPEEAEGKIITEALKEANPNWIGGNHSQAIKIAEEMASAPRLPPLPGLVLNETGAVRWMRVLYAVAKHHKIDAKEIVGISRKRHVIQARFEVFYRLRVDLNFSYNKIAGLMKKDHSTIIHGVNKVKRKLLDDAVQTAEYDGPSAANTQP